MLLISKIVFKSIIIYVFNLMEINAGFNNDVKINMQELALCRV